MLQGEYQYPDGRIAASLYYNLDGKFKSLGRYHRGCVGPYLVFRDRLVNTTSGEVAFPGRTVVKVSMPGDAGVIRVAFENNPTRDFTVNRAGELVPQ